MNFYIHVPFCRSKCGYCAFYSETACTDDVIEAYLDKLCRQLSQHRGEVAETLYIGGGTPTLLSAKQLKRLTDMVAESLVFADGAEKSIECNPETLDGEKLELLSGFFTRISVGVQSFDPALRQTIGRRCSQEKLLDVLDMVAQSGFKHWNCDLIYALPGQSAEAWQEELCQVAEYGVDHVSCYALTAEEEAALGFELVEDDDRAEAFYHMAAEVLAKYGIRRYEISNYAVPGGECQHNLRVWRGEKLIGFGPSAAGFDGMARNIETPSLGGWLAGDAAEKDVITSEARLNEIFAVNLRTVAGWHRTMWENLPGADAWEKRLVAARLAAECMPGCFEIDDDSIKLSDRGRLFWNDAAAELL